MISKKSLSIVLMLLWFLSSAQEDKLSALTISDDLKKNANAVVRLNDYNINIEAPNKMVVTLNRIVTVLNDRGDYYTQAYLGYDNFRKVKKIEAKVFDAMGNEIKRFKKKDFVDQSAVDGGTLYSDSRILIMAYTPISYPYTVQFTYEIESSNTSFVPNWTPVFTYYMSIENNTYTVNDNAELGLRLKEKNFDDFNVLVNKAENSTSYSLSNFNALKYEDLSPELNNVMPSALVATRRFQYHGVNGIATNWMEYGDWMINKLLKGRNEVSPETKAEIKRLVNTVEDPMEKAKLVYEYVQENTRYISVQVGIGGIQPISAMEVDQVKYGDCKGLTNYTQALLEVVGIPSYYCHVEAGNTIVDFEEDFASLEQGNHVILAIPNNDDMVWIDCTSQKSPFGFIGDFTDNRNVLVIKEGESKIIKTEAYLEKDNSMRKEALITVNADGSINSEVKIVSKGIQYDTRFHLEDQSHKDVVEKYKNYWSDINNLEIEQFNFNNNKKEVSFFETVKISARNYASENGDRLILTPNVFSKNKFVPKRYRNRQMPLEIQRGYADEDVFTIKLPEGYTLGALPSNVEIENKFGNYSVEYSQKENQLIYKRKLLIKPGTYSKDDYELYRQFRRKVAKSDGSLIVLNKT